MDETTSRFPDDANKLCQKWYQGFDGNSVCLLEHGHEGRCELKPHDCPDCGTRHGICRQCGTTYGQSHERSCVHATPRGRWA